MTTGDFATNRDNFCYRHPNRQSFVLCQRCTRTICGDCQTPASVGVICPECMKEQRQRRSPAQKRAQRRWRGGAGAGSGSFASTVTGTPGMMWIFVLTAAVFLIDWLGGYLGFSLNSYLLFWAPDLYPAFGTTSSAAPALGPFQPWRILTAALTHSGFLHIALNMLALWMLGRQLEPLLGTGRFVTTYLLSAAGGSAAVALLSFDTPVVGASGAIFGLFGALIVIGRRLGANMTGMIVVLAINLVYGFIRSGSVSWQAHVGGLVIGALIGLIFSTTRRRDQRRRQFVLLGAVGVGTIALFLLPPLWGYVW